MASSNTTGSIVSIVIGAILLVIAILRPLFLWNFDLVVSLRGAMGETVARILFGVAGVLLAGGGVLALLKNKSA